MNEYLKQYIELQKQFRKTEGNPDSVRALYAFKEDLEHAEDRQAKEVLVDVYDLLDFKKDAYELLCQIGNRSDKKTLKRLGQPLCPPQAKNAGGKTEREGAAGPAGPAHLPVSPHPSGNRRF